MNIKRLSALILLVGGLAASPVFSAELMFPAGVMDSGKWSVSVYGRDVEMKPVLEISNTSGAQIPLTSGSATIFSAANADVELEQEFEAVVAAFRFRPKNGLTYRAKIGQIQSFDVEYSSGGHTNKLAATRNGILWGVGAEWNVAPGSIVTPAFTLDASWTRMEVDLDKFTSPGVVAATANKFQQDEVQLALNASKRFGKVEPFGGLKISRVISRIKDQNSKESVRGSHDGWAPFVGIEVEFFEAESVIIEASFADDQSVNAGFNIKF